MKFERYHAKEDKTRTYDLALPLDMARYAMRECYAWPGGYEFVAIVEGDLVCSKCLRDNAREVLQDTKDGYGSYVVSGLTNESELEDDFCSDCNKHLGYHD